VEDPTDALEMDLFSSMGEDTDSSTGYGLQFFERITGYKAPVST